MFSEGQIIYFDPFYFKNGNTPKPKYFVILKTIKDSVLIASLSTSKNNVPYFARADRGCIELAEFNFNCFVFNPKDEVTTCGKSFDLYTYVYGFQIDDYQVEKLMEIHPLEGADFIVWGQLKPEIFKKLIECFKSSKAVKRKYKKVL